MRPWELEREIEHDPDVAYWVSKLAATWADPQQPNARAAREAASDAQFRALEAKGYKIATPPTTEERAAAQPPPGK